jgi:molybdopterin synthase sulfur carrier subunit
MKLKIKFLRPFSDIVGKRELEVDFKGSSLEDLLKVLIGKYPQLKKEFFTKTDEFTDYICVFVNDKPISTLKGVNTLLKNGDELVFFVPVSGG